MKASSLFVLSLVGVILACASEASETRSNATGGASSGGSSASGGSESGGSGGVLLSCDDGFTFSQNPAQAGVPFEVSYTADTGYTYVDMQVSGPGSPSTSNLQVSGDGPFTWTYTVSGHAAGVLSFAFLEGKTGGDPGNTLASCQVQSTAGPGVGGSGGSLGGGFVSANGTHFSRDGVEYRFVGANLRGLTHYGHHDALQYAAEDQIELNLAAVQGMGGRVVRAFVSYRELDTQETGDRLGTILDALAAHDLTLIVVFTDFYDTGFNPAGDDDFYASDLNGFTVLDHAFFQNGYTQSYKPHVEALVARFKSHPAVFSWELGNEIRDATFADSNPDTFIAFCKDMAATIRGIDPNHMISVGEITSLGMGMDEAHAAQIFGDPNVSFLTMRSYDGGNTDDTGFAAGLQKPIIVEEAGISGGDRPAQLAVDLDKWFDKGCRGYLQWGFSAGTSDNGDGDTQFGMDKVWHAGDWDAMYATYLAFAQSL